MFQKALLIADTAGQSRVKPSVLCNVGNKLNEARACLSIGNEHYGLGEFSKAVDYYEKYLEVSKERDKGEQARAYTSLGNAYYGLGEFSRAIEFYIKAMEIAKETGDKVAEGRALGNLGNSHHSLGEYKQAIVYHERRLELAKEAVDVAGEGKALLSLGTAYAGLGDHSTAIQYFNKGQYENALELHQQDLEISQDKALKLLEKKLDIAVQLDDKSDEGVTYAQLANTCLFLSEFRKAIAYHEKGLKIAQMLRDKPAEGVIFGDLGSAYFSLGEYTKAAEYHAKALEVAKEIEDQQAEMLCQARLGKANECLGNYQHLGDNAKATEYFNRQLELAVRLVDRPAESKAYYNLGLTEELTGSQSEAIAFYAKAINAIEAVVSFFEGALDIKQQAVDRLALMMSVNGDADKALALFDACKSQTPETPNKYDERAALTGVEICQLGARSSVSFMVFRIDLSEGLWVWIVPEGCGSDGIVFQKLADWKSDKKGSDDFVQAVMGCVKGTVGPQDLEVLSSVLFGNETVAAQMLHLQLKAKTTMIVVPQGVLWSVPFSALTVSGSSPFVVGEHFKVVLAPTVNSYRALQRRKLDFPRGIKIATVIGCPSLLPNSFTPSQTKQLKAANAEATRVVELLGVDPEYNLFLDADATKLRIVGSIVDAELVHVASLCSPLHGFTDRTRPYGAIALSKAEDGSESDTWLRSSEICRLRLKRSPLVVLSACSCDCDHAKDFKLAESILGISEAFLIAGARGVIISLWSRGGMSSGRFMELFYETASTTGITDPSAALFLASEKVRAETGDPSTWACFVHIGTK
eukprot:m51a1_g2331 hypothetical protein (809) ;mRNA; f:525096-528157